MQKKIKFCQASYKILWNTISLLIRIFFFISLFIYIAALCLFKPSGLSTVVTWLPYPNAATNINNREIFLFCIKFLVKNLFQNYPEKWFLQNYSLLQEVPLANVALNEEDH